MSTGTVNIGAAAGSPAVAPGTLDTPAVVFQDGTATLNFNHTSTNYVFAPAISGNGAVNVLAGITILTANNTYTGATTINGGALIVNGSIASSSLTTVNSGAALLGSGTVGSTVINSRRLPRSGSGGNARHDDRHRQSRVSVRRVIRRAGQSHDGFEHQCERHRLACRAPWGPSLRRAAIWCAAIRF